MSAPETEFLTAVERAFAPELQRGELKIVEHDFFPQHFGDAFVTLQGPGYLLKLVREKSHPYALVAPLRSPTWWERLQLAISAAVGELQDGAVEPLGWGLPVENAAELFRTHHLKLADAYRPWRRWQLTKLRLWRLARVQQRRFDKWLDTPRSESERSAEQAEIERQLQNPSPELRKALDALGLHPQRRQDKG